VIADFGLGNDVIDLSGIDANDATGGDDAFTFFINAEPGTDPGVQAHGITWYQSGGDTLIQGDVTGDTTADFEIQLTGQHTLAEADFVL